MNFIGLLLLTILTYILDYCFCSPCGSHPELGYYDLTSGDLSVVGCHGTFWGGMDDLSVDTICGDGYHVCDSALEATDLGLTHSKCSNIIPDGKLFFLRESSNGHGQCDSVYNTNGSNDVWGCSSNNSWTNVCNFLPGSYSDCLSMSVFCWSFNGGTIYDTSGTTPVIEFGSDGDNEYNNMEISNPNYGGVLCCKDDETTQAPAPRVSGCYECAEPCNKLTDEYGCADNECLDNCKYCISDISWYDYDGGQDNRCQCHNNGCDQCEDGWFKLDYDFPCQECDKLTGCLHCTDFWGCQQCSDGYTLKEHSTCGEDSLLNTGNTKFHYCEPEEGGCDGDDDDGGRVASESVCYECAEQCTELTEELGCANNECLDTCKNCISDIAWDDYDGGQDNGCQCHNNGCDECQDGWFKLDYDFPCQECSKLAGCLHCTDFLGCQQCEDGYTLTEHSTCGENSLLNTGNAKFHYCKPNDGSDCGDGSDGAPVITPSPVAARPSCSLNLGECDSDPCDCNIDSKCNDCENYGCETCDDGYFKKSFGNLCVECTTIAHCQECSDWQGCTECHYGYTPQWDSNCGVNVCVANPFG